MRKQRRDGPPRGLEDELKEQRRREREAQDEARRQAVAHNAELGAAAIKHLSRLKVRLSEVS